MSIPNIAGCMSTRILPSKFPWLHSKPRGGASKHLVGRPHSNGGRDTWRFQGSQGSTLAVKSPTCTTILQHIPVLLEPVNEATSDNSAVTTQQQSFSAVRARQCYTRFPTPWTTTLRRNWVLDKSSKSWWIFWFKVSFSSNRGNENVHDVHKRADSALIHICIHVWHVL